MNTLLLPRKGRARLKIDVEDWHNSLSGLLHLRVRAPSHLSRDKSLAVQPSAVAALVKKKKRKKKPTKKPQHGGRIPCNNLGAHAVSFYRNNLILSSFDLPNVTVCFHPCNHLEFKPLSPTVSIRRRILPDSQGHLWACGMKTVKLSNASFAVQRNSHF